MFSIVFSHCTNASSIKICTSFMLRIVPVDLVDNPVAVGRSFRASRSFRWRPESCLFREMSQSLVEETVVASMEMSPETSGEMRNDRLTSLGHRACKADESPCEAKE